MVAASKPSCLRVGQPSVLLGGDHDNSFAAMFRYALWTPLAGKSKPFAEARFGVLKLPLLLDDRDFWTPQI